MPPRAVVEGCVIDRRCPCSLAALLAVALWRCWFYAPGSVETAWVDFQTLSRNVAVSLSPPSAYLAFFFRAPPAASPLD